MIVNYPERKGSTMKSSTGSKGDGEGTIIPKSAESIQTYARGKDVEHPDEAMKEESPIDAQWPKKPDVVEYPRHD